MRSNVRRLFSLLLAVALVLGLGLTSVAATRALSSRFRSHPSM